MFCYKKHISNCNIIKECTEIILIINLILGNSPDGLKLLQRYLDVSGDIQTTTLIAVRAFPTELASDTVKEWIQK